MSLYRKIQSIKAQIIDTERLLEIVHGHPLMSEGLEDKLRTLKSELESLPKESFETSLQLLFSGNAVYGSQGIKSTFVSKIITPIQGMIKTQLAIVKYGKVGNRGKTKKKANTDLFLTALPTGSFGIELSQIDNNEHDLFDTIDTSEAIKSVMNLIANTAKDDETFESTIEKMPKRNLKNLKKFLQEIAEENSILKMESGELAIELSKEKVIEASHRVSSTTEVENEIIINGIFRGLLLDSGKFEIQNENGNRLSGFISEDLSEEQLIEYDKLFLNTDCTIHLKVHLTRFVTGNEKTDYELIEIERNIQIL
ncbi:TPA: hypothetical protein ACGZ9Q_002005 [Elizabethkingia anophelis]|uniref:hypothetical protein n=1 Tax=Elizabethkingia anophelis TaxID=1117645 RepID=UPI00136EA852|nr:hypothetical protein [Elizabethkingia anophelis]MCT3732667.1 hypothetical protein [Elizabethkingia anophelis]MYY23921.1 hypothetical protein [Elizabethkingia anophelis]